MLALYRMRPERGPWTYHWVIPDLRCLRSCSQLLGQLYAFSRLLFGKAFADRDISPLIDGVQQHIAEGPNVWRIPFGIQLVPAGIMAFGLLFTTESPRWLAMRGRSSEALKNLAFLRRRHIDDPEVTVELAEIEASIKEERDARIGLGLKEAFFGPGNGIRFLIAFIMFVLQQFSGQNSVGYYAPQIFQVSFESKALVSFVANHDRLFFQSIGYSKTGSSILASGVYGSCRMLSLFVSNLAKIAPLSGIVKVAATSLFIFFLIDYGGRRISLLVSSIGMGVLFYIIGAILKTHPPIVDSDVVAPASKAMAALLYIYVVFYSCGKYFFTSRVTLGTIADIKYVF